MSNTNNETLDWDRLYRGDSEFEGQPPWNIGEPQPALASLIEGGSMKGKILDAGCGHAELSFALAARGHVVVGIELSQAAVDASRATAERRGLSNATFVQDDITSFRGYDEYFDTIVDSTLFHSLPVEARDDYQQSVYRAAAPGALYFVLVFAQGAFPTGLDRVPNQVTEHELRAVVEKYWRVIDIRPASIHAVPLPRPSNIPDIRLPSHPLDSAGRLIYPAFLLSACKPDDL